MSEDWDVESYRTEFESDEHWELKKNFMLTHKDRLPEDEVVCLAQVFTNIEFLGCRYPEETMQKVAELAKGVVESYRKKKENCLKRTFVAASDAAASKVKGLNHSAIQDGKLLENFKRMRNNCNLSKTANFNKTTKSHSADFNRKNKFRNERNMRKGSGATWNRKPSGSRSMHNLNIKKLNGPFADFVLFMFDDHPANLLQRNASLNKCSISWKYSPVRSHPFICKVYLNDHLVGTGEGKTKKISKELAARDAVQKLQSSCYIIKIKATFASQSTISPAELDCSHAEESEVKCNIGEQIMKLMGWTGGGLGVKQQGMIEPISLLSNFGRSGLGLKYAADCDPGFKNRARDFIRKWMKSDTDQDLVFSSEFGVEQRKILHELARSLSLRSKSYGKGEQRHLVVSKKPSPWQIVEELMKVGGNTSKYELIVPDIRG